MNDSNCLDLPSHRRTRHYFVGFWGSSTSENGGCFFLTHHFRGDFDHGKRMRLLSSWTGGATSIFVHQRWPPSLPRLSPTKLAGSGSRPGTSRGGSSRTSTGAGAALGEQGVCGQTSWTWSASNWCQLLPFFFWGGEGSPTKRDYRKIKVGTLILASLLEDLVELANDLKQTGGTNLRTDLT